MSVTKANVLVGIGTFSADNVDVGSTAGGIEASKTLGYHEKKVDQFLDALDLVPIDVSFVTRTVIAEGTLENLTNVWNEKVGPSGATPAKTLKLGINVLATEHVIDFTGRSPISPSAFRTYHLFRGVSFGSSAHMVKKDDQVGFPWELRCLPDPSKNAGEEYGTIVE